MIYKFVLPETTIGNIMLDKERGVFVEIEPVPDCELPATNYFEQATMKMTMCLANKNGEFPERMAYQA